MACAPSPRVVADGEEVPKGGGAYMVGKPYKIAGQTYVPSEKPYAAVGMASWYGSDFHGRRTANGEVFDRDSIIGGASDHAAAELRPRHQSEQFPLDHRARQ